MKAEHWRTLCGELFVFLCGCVITAGIFHMTNREPWHYEKTKSTKGYDYWTNSAGVEILVIVTKPIK
jgi:hypothetical protein